MSYNPLAILGAVTLVACGGGGGVTVGSSPGGDAELLAVHHGLLVDVYGLRDITGGRSLSLFQTDVLVGPDIRDEREAGEDKSDEDITYDFLSANPDTLS